MTFEVNERPVAAGGPDDRLLPWGRVKDIAGISRTTAWRLQKVGDFPEPVPISAQRVGWWESELTAWKASRKRGERPRAFTPARAPALIETARSSRSPKPTAAPAAPISPPAPVALVLEKPVRRQPRRRPVSPDQFDFGF